MRILMLGWEFPPFISGGLGTACYGLTRALDDLGHDIMFVLPKAVDDSMSSHVKLISPDEDEPDQVDDFVRTKSGQMVSTEVVSHVRYKLEQFEHVEFVGVPSTITSPYGTSTTKIDTHEMSHLSQRSQEELIALRTAGAVSQEDLAELLGRSPEPESENEAASAPGDYDGDVIGASRRYARMVVRLCREAKFDVIHAHDWMTYPAGVAMAQLTGKPLVAHIHSTEFDRSGEHVNQAVYDIERRGMHAAVKVVAVSHLTKNICSQRYAVDPSKIGVVYNGIENNGHGPLTFGAKTIEPRDKIVLFLGRITMQKGPEYFVQAAQRVLEKIPNTKFLVAGSGDMARRMIELAAEMGIGHKVLFTGFLRGQDVQRIFQLADCYVMPSVSEPFGIAPLEAMSHGTPTIISKQSGVSEVLQSVLKVDFWDTDEMANLIVAVLRHPPLRDTLREHGSMEIRTLTWKGAAEKCTQVYKDAINAVPAGVPMS